MNFIWTLLFIFNLFATTYAGSVTINGEVLNDLGENFNLEECINNHPDPITILEVEGIELHEFPTLIFSLKDLKKLSLIKCGLTGPVPAIIGKLNNLEELNLSHNKLTGEPQNIQKLLMLKKLVLSHNTFYSLPDLDGLTQLSHVDFQHNILDQQCFRCRINKMPDSLLALKVNNCGITSPLPHLENCTKLEFIDFSRNKITGQIPQSWAKFHNLKMLFLHENCLQGAVPDKIWELYQLHTLFISWNRDLSVSVPEKIQYLDELRVLGFHDCKMVGPVPKELLNTKLNALLFGPLGDFSEAIDFVPKSIIRLNCGFSKNRFDTANFPKLKSFFVDLDVSDPFAHEFSTKLPLSDFFQKNIKRFLRFQTGIPSITILILNNNVEEGNIHCFYNEDGQRHVTLSFVEKERPRIPIKKLLEMVPTPQPSFAEDRLPDELMACAWEPPTWYSELEPIVSAINAEFEQDSLPSLGDKRSNAQNPDEPNAKKPKN